MPSPRKDLPEFYKMDPRAVEVVAEVAPAQRVFLGQLLDALENVDGVEFNARHSFAAEVLAAQVNLLADKLRERHEELSPGRHLGHSETVNIIVSDIMNRALLRRLRGDD